MEKWELEKERCDLENALKDKRLDFTATYMVVQTLHFFIKKHPDLVGPETIPALKYVFERTAHASQKQVFFLYRETADTLISIMIQSSDASLAKKAALTLKKIICGGTNHLHRAAAEAMGSLPLPLRGPQLTENPSANIPHVTWEEMLQRTGIASGYSFRRIGRSIVIDIDDPNIFVVKLAGSKDSAEALKKEAQWMEYLGLETAFFPVRFEIPTPFRIKGNHVFLLSGPPIRMPGPTQMKQKYYAICFIVHKDYFGYPNDHRNEFRIPEEKFRNVLLQNAYLLGKLASSGILHNSLIPLFHNRVQINRRDDDGIYQWSRGGRLDSWLTSCRYPNFGLSGIRDFEHFEPFNGKHQKLYHAIGSYMLSLALVAGSYFRHKDPARTGFDDLGHPVDVRDFFDKTLFKDLMENTFLQYYNGFVGKDFKGDLPVDFDFLVDRMIEEMGVDSHMEEILRVTDQEAMTDKEFETFLSQRGYDQNKIARMKRGEKDITILTGPHLGGFNERISLPELIWFIETASALCIYGMYEQKKEGYASPQNPEESKHLFSH